MKATVFSIMAATVAAADYLAAGEACVHSGECESDCCAVKNMNDKGVTEHYDKKGFPVRLCAVSEDYCEMKALRGAEFYLTLAGILFGVFLFLFLCVNYFTKSSEIKRLRIRLDKAHERLMNGEGGKDLLSEKGRFV